MTYKKQTKEEKIHRYIQYSTEMGTEIQNYITAIQPKHRTGKELNLQSITLNPNQKTLSIHITVCKQTTYGTTLNQDQTECKVHMMTCKQTYT